ncbi:hypothetical protein [Nannocystis pusilla]|uniref:hypothetical protein n=1 Tax=Nannocystis pusilla TaxID=889268 RepID=UPI003B8115E5
MGIRRFKMQGPRREAAGFNPRWSLKDLLGGRPMGRNDAKLITRAEDGRFLLQLVHRDDDDPSELWHIATELQRIDNRTTRIRHAQGRTGPMHREMRAKIGAPAVVRELLKWNGPNVVPKGLGDGSVLRFTSDEAEDVLRYIILDADRRCGLVLISPTLSDGLPFVPPERLSLHLAGQVRVLACADLPAAEGFSRALQNQGYSNRFGAWNGTVRLYHPQITPDDHPYRHRFWNRERLESYEPELLVDSLAGEIAERALQGSVPRGFFTLVEQFDRAQLDQRAILLLESTHENARDLEQQLALNAELRAQVEAQRQQLENLKAELASEQTCSEEFAQACTIAEQERDFARAKVEALGLALSSRTPSGGLSQKQREALAAVFERQEPSPVQCLHALAAVYGDRVEILHDAYESAQGRESFRQGHTLLELLISLVTDYWQRMVDGGAGDGVAREIFGKKFCAKESETTMNNARAKRERTLRIMVETT